MGSKKEPKKVFIRGAISAEKIGKSIAAHQTKTNIGAHDIFLGQVEEKDVNGKHRTAIKFSCFEDVAELVFHEIREKAFEKFDLSCMHIYHSSGYVNVGEIYLFVFVSSAHRKDCMEACRWLAEEIKMKVPVFENDVFNDGSKQWASNK